jgi:hypothetical protein
LRANKSFPANDYNPVETFHGKQADVADPTAPKKGKITLNRPQEFFFLTFNTDAYVIKTELADWHNLFRRIGAMLPCPYFPRPEYLEGASNEDTAAWHHFLHHFLRVCSCPEPATRTSLIRQSGI